MDTIYEATPADRDTHPERGVSLYGEVHPGVWINYATARTERGLANSFRHLPHVKQFVVTRRLAEPAD